MLRPQKPKLITFDAAWRILRETNRLYIEPKLNGSRCLVVKDKKGNITLYTRHGHPFRNYQPPKAMLEQLSVIEKDSILDGELLALKVPGYKNKLVLFDVIKWKGKFLDGVEYADRLLHLAFLKYPGCVVPPKGSTPQVYKLAKFDHLLPLWLSLKPFQPLVEGVVIKLWNSPLRYGKQSCPPAVGWYKLRYPKENLYAI